jgi:hypothetical protein
MTGLVDRYLAAMVKHDPSGLPLAKGVRYTENTVEIQVGEGLWVGASEAQHVQDLRCRSSQQSGRVLRRDEGMGQAADHRDVF